MKPLVLVIESDAGTRKLLDVLLARFGYEVDLVSNAADALILLDTVDYDCMFTDRTEPLLPWLASHRASALQRLVNLTSVPEAKIAKLRAEWPVVSIIRKPFDLADVVDAARAITSKRAPRPRTFAENFCRRSVLAGAKSGVLVRRNGKFAELVCSFGYAPETLAEWFPLDLEKPYPMCAAMRHGRPVWFASVTNARNEYPIAAAVFEKNQSRAAATVPLMRDGIAIGAAGWAFREPQRFDERAQHVWLAIAEEASEFVREDSASESATRAGA